MVDNIQRAVPRSADTEEAAAIAAAVSTYLSEEDPENESVNVPSWRGRRWQFAGQMSALQRRTPRIPIGAPTDAWTASGRTDRM